MRISDWSSDVCSSDLETAGVHPVHLAREFHRRFGCTVGHYIRQRRIEFACHRLTASRDPLSEIAVEAGFADQDHLTNTFRRLVGMPPARVRARSAAAPFSDTLYTDLNLQHTHGRS